MTATLETLQARNMASTMSRCVADRFETLTVEDLQEMELTLCGAYTDATEAKAKAALWIALEITEDALWLKLGLA